MVFYSLLALIPASRLPQSSAQLIVAFVDGERAEVGCGRVNDWLPKAYKHYGLSIAHKMLSAGRERQRESERTVLARLALAGAEKLKLSLVYS